MTDKEKLEAVKVEVERRIEKHKQWVGNSFGCAEERKEELEDLLSFIDSMLDSEIKNDKTCMYTKDEYSSNDRVILCKDCEEECKFNKRERNMRRIIIEEFPSISLICSITGWAFLLLLFAHAIDHRLGCVCCLTAFSLGSVFLTIYWSHEQ